MKHAQIFAILKALPWVVGLSGFGAVACVTGKSAPAGPSFATDLPPGDTDGILVEWRNCVDSHPCMQGEAEGRAYSLHFVDSPSTVAGTVGDKAIRMSLDPNSVYRLGDHAIDLSFRDPTSGAVLELTWNERDQRPIGHALLLPN